MNKIKHIHALQLAISDLAACGVENVCIAGGYLRDSLLGKPPTDIDFFYEGKVTKEMLSHFHNLYKAPNGLDPNDPFTWLLDDANMVTIDSSAYPDQMLEQVTTFTSKFDGLNIQLIEVKDVMQSFQKFPCTLSQVMLTEWGLTMEADFVCDAADKVLWFTDDCPKKYYDKIVAKYHDYKVGNIPTACHADTVATAT